MLIRQCMNIQGPKKTIAVFDGGGVHGRFALELCRFMAKDQPIPLSELFSMLVGVSSGAIVATIIALGIFDDPSTVDTTCASFVEMMPSMFSLKQFGYPFFCSKYDGTGKTAVLRRVIGDRCLGDVKTPLVILCADLRGSSVIFRSWDQEQKHLRLVDVLDASSAAPMYFPPVAVDNVWLTDGGVRATKPLIIALLTAIEYLDQGNFYMLSIGTHVTSKRMFLASKVKKMGLLGWLEMGFIEILLGFQDRTAERLMTALFSNKFLRLECACDVRIDDWSARNQDKLQDLATTVWEQEKNNIITFLRNANSS